MIGSPVSEVSAGSFIPVESSCSLSLSIPSMEIYSQLQTNATHVHIEMSNLFIEPVLTGKDKKSL